MQNIKLPLKRVNYKKFVSEHTVLFKRHFANYALFVASFLVAFATNTLIANHYKAELFGQYQYYNSLIVFLLSLSQVGTTQSFIVFASKKINRQKLIGANYVLSILGFLAVSSLMCIVFFITKQHLLAYLFALYLLPQTIAIAPVLDYYKKSYIDTKYNFLIDILPSLAMIFICMKAGFSIEIMVIFRIITKSMAEFFKYLYIKNNLSKLTFSWRFLRWYFLKSRMFVVNRVLVNFYSRSELLLLGFIAAKKPLGIYAAAYGVSSAILVLSALIDRQLFAKLSQAFGDYKQTKKMLIYSIIIKSLYVIPVILCTTTFGSEILFTYIFKKSEYHDSAIILNIMTIGMLSSIFVNNTNLMLMKKDQSSYTIRFALGIVLNIFLGYVLYQKYSIYGFASAMSLVKIITITYSIYISAEMLNELKEKELKGIKND